MMIAAGPCRITPTPNFWPIKRRDNTLRLAWRAIQHCIAHISVGILMCCIVSGRADAQRSLAPDAIGCARLLGNSGHDFEVTRVGVHTGDFRAPDGKTYRVPGLCRVVGISRPTPSSEIHFELWLPTESWNGRYYQHAPGGFGGTIDYAALARLASSGSAVATSDNGWRPESVFTTKMRENPEKYVDLFYRAAVHTSRISRQLVAAYYGRGARRHYFEGCSGGGRAAWAIAHLQPEQWDGFVIGAPNNNATNYFVANAWIGRLWLDATTRLPPEKLPAIQREALKSCKPPAFAIRGIATDPRYCRFDPARMLCRGQETNNCLTHAQVATLTSIYQGPSDPHHGNRIYPGFPPTSETQWAGSITATEAAPDAEPRRLISANRYFRNDVFDQSWSATNFDFARDVRKAERVELLGEPMTSFNYDNPDVDRVRMSGAKILMYFGWSDAALTPLEGIRFYEEMARRSGGFAKLQRFFKFFLVPGMNHCEGGEGPNAFGQLPSAPALQDDRSYDVMRAIEAWAEDGISPKLRAVKYRDNDPSKGPTFELPICAYPASLRPSSKRKSREHWDCK